MCTLSYLIPQLWWLKQLWAGWASHLPLQYFTLQGLSFSIGPLSPSRIVRHFFYVAAVFPEGENKSCKAFCGIRPEVIQQNCCCTLLVKASHRASPDLRSGEKRLRLLMGGAACMPEMGAILGRICRQPTTSSNRNLTTKALCVSIFTDDKTEAQKG